MFKTLKNIVFGTGKDAAGNDVPRLESVEYTLSAGDPDTPKQARTPPAYTGDLAARIAAATAGLKAINIAAATRLGLGSEQRFEFDQDEGALHLTYPNGITGAFPAQFIGSFDPRAAADVRFSDLGTREKSLEDIFVDLVSTRRRASQEKAGPKLRFPPVVPCQDQTIRASVT
jgi:hypothetical protein